MMPSEKQITFPKFLHGAAPAVQRRIKAEAKRWAQLYVTTKRFPDPEVAAVAPGTVVITSGVADLQRETSAWRLYFTRLLGGAINEALDWKDHERVSADFEAFVRTFPWGALSAAIEHVAPNSIAVVSTRLVAALKFWDILDELRYRDKGLRPITLSELMGAHFVDLLQTWLPHPHGDIRRDLESVVDLLRGASADEVRARVISRLQELALTDTRLKHRDRFQDGSWLESEIAKAVTDPFQNLATGHTPDLLRALYIVDDSISH